MICQRLLDSFSLLHLAVKMFVLINLESIAVMELKLSALLSIGILKRFTKLGLLDFDF